MFKVLMKNILWCLLMMCITFNTEAQKLRTSLGDKYFNNYQFKEAARVYENLYRSDTSDLSVIDKLVTCYTRLNETKNTERWLKVAINKYPPNSKLYRSYAAALASNEKYHDAEIWFQKAYDLNNESGLLQWKETYADLSSFFSDSSLFKIQKAHFNSSQSDFSPAYFGEGLIFCSARENGKIGKYKYDFNNTWFIDLYYLKDSLAGPSLFSKRLNSKYHEGPVAFNRAQDTIYFTRNRIDKKKNLSPDGVNKLEIYYAAISNGKAGKLHRFELNNPDYSVGHPAIWNSEEIIFASDMPGGYGGTDLYISRKKDGTWQKPVNLGPEINTAGNELFPFVDDKGELYFASNGHPGLGGLDVFHTTRSSNGFLPVKNMGFPINSSKDDFGLIASGHSGYFSSNRNGSTNNDNIYRFVMTGHKLVVIQVKDDTGRLLSDVDILVEKNSEVKSLKFTDIAISYKWQSGDNQKMKFTKSGYKEAELEFNALRYHQSNHGDTIFVSLAKIEVPKKEVPKKEVAQPVTTAPSLFKEIDTGQIIELDIKYDVNRANINPNAAKQLDVLVEFMKNHPTVRVELGSHSDSRGSAELNQQLSQKRAESAVEYITSKGIDEARLIAVGYGKNQLKIQNAQTEAEHHQNRRTTVKIIASK